MHIQTLAINEATVNYNASARQWWVLTDEGQAPLAEFPAGQQGKLNAQKFAVQRDHPALYEELLALVENSQLHPEASDIEKRAVQATLLVRAGHVLSPRPIDAPLSYVNEIARVRSQSDPGLEYGIYLSTWRETCLACECADFENGNYRAIFGQVHPESQRPGAPQLWSGQVVCKHILAQLFVDALALVDEELSNWMVLDAMNKVN